MNKHRSLGRIWRLRCCRLRRRPKLWCCCSSSRLWCCSKLRCSSSRSCRARCRTFGCCILSCPNCCSYDILKWFGTQLRLVKDNDSPLIFFTQKKNQNKIIKRKKKQIESIRISTTLHSHYVSICVFLIFKLNKKKKTFTEFWSNQSIR